MKIRHVKPEDSEQWLSMRAALWPETEKKRHCKEMEMILFDAGRSAVLVCEAWEDGLVGFTEVSLRAWAEGCSSSPVGYLEGWYVAEHARGKGIGKKLLAASEDWARSHGCTEMASDTDLENKASEKVHLKLGFQVVGRVVAFRKAL